MLRLDRIAAIEVGDGTGDAQDAYHAPARQVMPARHLLDEPRELAVETARLYHLVRFR